MLVGRVSKIVYASQRIVYRTPDGMEVIAPDGGIQENSLKC
jgi:hypothetical protein